MMSRKKQQEISILLRKQNDSFSNLFHQDSHHTFSTGQGAAKDSAMQEGSTIVSHVSRMQITTGHVASWDLSSSTICCTFLWRAIRDPFLSTNCRHPVYIEQIDTCTGWQSALHFETCQNLASRSGARQGRTDSSCTTSQCFFHPNRQEHLDYDYNT